MEQQEMETRRLFFCGDIHGEFRSFVFNALDKYQITNSDIVILGDFGVGFDNSLCNQYSRIEYRLKNANVKVWVLRGNHDSDVYFSDEEKYSYPYLRFMEDHKVYRLADHDLYIIGGACSTDITWRLEANEKLAARGKDRRVWWPGEEVVKKYDNLPDKVDIILSHTAPIGFLPITTRFSETPDWQYKKIVEERTYLQHLLTEDGIRADYWFYGHFHQSWHCKIDNVMFRMLDIMELHEIH